MHTNLLLPLSSKYASLQPLSHLTFVCRPRRPAVVCSASKGFGDKAPAQSAKSGKDKSKPKKQVAHISSEQVRRSHAPSALPQRGQWRSVLVSQCILDQLLSLLCRSDLF